MQPIERTAERIMCWALYAVLAFCFLDVIVALVRFAFDG